MANGDLCLQVDHSLHAIRRTSEPNEVEPTQPAVVVKQIDHRCELREEDNSMATCGRVGMRTRAKREDEGDSVLKCFLM